MYWENNCSTKGTFIIEKNNLLFGMCYSVPFAPRGVASADSPKISLENPRKYYYWECKGILSGILSVCSKNWHLTVVL